jgi:hypothetical protein
MLINIYHQLQAMGWVHYVPADPENKIKAHFAVEPEVHALFAERAEQERTRRQQERETILKAFGRK